MLREKLRQPPAPAPAAPGLPRSASPAPPRCFRAPQQLPWQRCYGERPSSHALPGKKRQEPAVVPQESFTSPSDADVVPFPFGRGRAPTQTPPHRRSVTRCCRGVSSQRSSTSTPPRVTEGPVPRRSRPWLLFALVVVGRGVLPLLDQLVPLLQDGFQPRSLAKRTREGQGRRTTGP